MAACWYTPKKNSILVCIVALNDFFAEYKQTRNWAPRGVPNNAKFVCGFGQVLNRFLKTKEIKKLQC